VRALALGIGTLFGAGRSPIAPGTVGAAVALVVPAAIAFLAPQAYAPALFIGAIVLAVVGPAVAQVMIDELEDNDPRSFVLDEVAGMWIAALRPAAPVWPTLLVAFFLFRLFDVWKPGLVGRLDRMHGGRGVMYDDLAAGALALAVGVALEVGWRALAGL